MEPGRGRVDEQYVACAAVVPSERRVAPAPTVSRSRAVVARRSSLVVGAAGDPAERDADRMVERVIDRIRSGETGAVAGPATDGGGIGRIARSAAVVGAAGGALDHDTAGRIDAARRGGRPLDASVRRPMEGAFGVDFSGVRLHVGAESDALNERIQARAFTLGPDVFVRRSDYAPATERGQRLLAHELAHTVQQGAGRVRPSSASRAQRVIRRITATEIVTQVRSQLDASRNITGDALFDPKQFKVATNTRGHMRGAALKAIDRYLVTFAAIPTTDIAVQRKLLVQMQYAAEQWIIDHSVSDAGAVRTPGSAAAAPPAAATTPPAPAGAAGATAPAVAPPANYLIDPKRKKRFAGMANFLEAVNGKVAACTRQLGDSKTGASALADLETSKTTRAEHAKLKAKYTGTPTSTLTKLGALIDMAVPNGGDGSEIEVAFRWPVDPTGVAFVGGTLRLSAQNSSAPGASVGGQASKNILARAELVFTFGAQWLDVGKIQAEIGGYLESSARTGRDCMTLMSYLLYRRCRESAAMPHAVADYLWSGGRKGAFGALKSEQWSNQVETDIIGKQSGAYVQSGIIAGVGGEASVGAKELGASVGGKISAGGGTRYDEESIKSAKSALGAVNERRAAGGASGAQKKLGRGVRFLTLEFEGSVGPFSGSAALRLQWQSEEALSTTPTYKLTGAELEFSASATVPNVGGDQLGERIAGWATEGVRTIVSKARAAVNASKDKKDTSMSAKERKDAKVGSGVGEVWGSVFDGLDHLRNVGGIEEALNPASGAFGTESSISLALTLGGDVIGKEFQFTISFEKTREFSVPLFLDISQTSTSRIVAWKLSGGKWQVL